MDQISLRATMRSVPPPPMSDDGGEEQYFLSQIMATVQELILSLQLSPGTPGWGTPLNYYISEHLSSGMERQRAENCIATSSLGDHSEIFRNGVQAVSNSTK